LCAWIWFECVQVCVIYLCCAYLGNSFEVKVESASNDITECPCDDKPSIGTLCFLYLRQQYATISTLHLISAATRIAFTL